MKHSSNIREQKSLPTISDEKHHEKWNSPPLFMVFKRLIGIEPLVDCHTNAK